MGNPLIAQALGDSSTRPQQRVGRLPVAESSGPHRVASQSTDCAPSVLVVGQTPGGPPVDGVEAERRAFQDQGFSDAAIRMILAATHGVQRPIAKLR